MADTPYIKYGFQKDAQRLYFSEPSAARKIPRTVKGGFGILQHGLLMAENTSAATKGVLIPYDMEALTGNEVAPGRMYLVADVGSGENEILVSPEDSYKVEVGDELLIRDTSTTYASLGAITSIDRTGYNAKIIVTTNTAAAFTVANKANVVIAGSTTAVGVLEKSVDTLKGVDALKANTTLILGNAVLYCGVIANKDSAGLTDINARQIGQFLDVA